MGHFDGELENLQPAAQPRHGLREYSSENGPLTFRGSDEAHERIQKTTVTVYTPSQIAALQGGAHEGEEAEGGEPGMS